MQMLDFTRNAAIFSSTEYTPCPLFECKYSTQKVVEQPVYLPQLNTNMLKSATSFIKYKASEYIHAALHPRVPIETCFIVASPLPEKNKPFFLFYSFVHLHKPQYSSERFANSSVRGTYGGSLVYSAA